ncbi:MAG: hypothetical protein AVDCRST_MAG88-4321, partial [uncultured Thermomicrobiales bacterium]
GSSSPQPHRRRAHRSVSRFSG